MAESTNRALQRSVALNRDTAGAWETFTPHRQRVTRLIVERTGTGVERLAILGAGNCNDVDLTAVTARAEIVDLIDLDETAVRGGLVHQGLEESPRIHVHAPLDVTGAAGVGDLRSGGFDHVPDLPGAGTCALVVSTCLLSALIAAAIDGITRDDASTSHLVTRIRDQHLAVLARHVRPGGRILLVSDLVSSDTCPELMTTALGEMGNVMTRALAARNFFTGTNPIAVAARLSEMMHEVADEVRILSPWRWPISSSRAYLVYAIEVIVRAPRPHSK